MNQVIFKHKTKRQGDWELPINGVFLEKFEDGKSVGLREIKYAKGAKSIWKEDIDDRIPGEKIWFKDGFLFVDKKLKNLLEICQKHPYLGAHFDIHDKAADAKKELEGLRAKDKIIQIIAEADVDKIVATSMAIFGMQAFSWDESTAELELRKYAEKNPKKLSDELESKTYESKYLSALAYGKGIVKYKLGKTAVVWNDSTEGEILKLARGENGIEKLGELLSKRTDETDVLLHAIMEKIEKLEVATPKTDDNEELQKMKAELEEKKKELELVKLRDEYKELYEVNLVPVRFKNDAEWIQKKIDEKLSE